MTDPNDLPEVPASEMPSPAEASDVTETVSSAETVDATLPEPKPTRDPGMKTVSDWGSGPLHHAARVLHKWDEYAHHMGEEMRLNVADYKAAVMAASKRKTEVTTDEATGRKTVRKFYAPHPAAFFDQETRAAEVAARHVGQKTRAQREAERKAADEAASEAPAPAPGAMKSAPANVPHKKSHKKDRK